MATLKEEFERMKIEIARANATGDTAALNRQIHIIDHAQERAARRENKRGSTRITIDCKTPEGYKELRPEIDRYFDLAVDPHIAIHVIARALHSYTDDQIKARVAAGHEPIKPGPPPEKANIPAWLK